MAEPWESAAPAKSAPTGAMPWETAAKPVKVAKKQSIGDTLVSGLKQNYEDFMSVPREASKDLAATADRVIGDRVRKMAKGDFSGTAKPGQTQQQADMQDALALGGSALNYATAPINGMIHAAVAPATRLANNALVDSGRVMPTIGIERSKGNLLPNVTVDKNVDREQSFRNLDNAVGAVGSIASMAIGNESGGASALSKASKAGKASKTANVVANAERLERSGVTPYAAIADAGPGKTAVTNFVAENPIAGVGVRSRLKRSVEQVEGRANALAKSAGEVRGAEATGEGVKSGVNAFANAEGVPATVGAPAKAASFKGKAEAVYDRAFDPILKKESEIVGNEQTRIANQTQAAKAKQQAEVARITEQRRLMPNGDNGPIDVPLDPIQGATPAVKPSETVATLRAINGRVNAPALSSVITSGPFQKIAKALEADGADIRFTDLRNLRTWVREAQGNPELRQNIGSANLQKLESALTNDIYSNAESLGGPSALHKLKQADTFYRAGSQRIKNALQPFASAKSGESAYSKIVQAAGSTSSADASKLISLKRSLKPEDWGDVTANVIDDLGRATAGRQNAEGDVFSVSTFVTNYNKLSERGKNILFGSSGGGGAKGSELRKAMDDLAFAANAVKEVEKGANVSKSGVVGQLIGTTAGLSNPYTILPTAGGLSGMAITGEAMTNPAFVRRLVAQARKANAQAQNQATIKRVSALPPLIRGTGAASAAANANQVPNYLAPAQSAITRAAAEDRKEADKRKK